MENVENEGEDDEELDDDTRIVANELHLSLLKTVHNAVRDCYASSLLPSLFMQFAKINNHEDSLSFSNLQKNIDRIKRLILSGFFVHHSFVLIELVSGKNVFHEGVFSKPRNN